MSNSICDTDLIVKISKEDYVHAFFENYSVVHFTDAVVQEIERRSVIPSTEKIFTDAKENISNYVDTDLACYIEFSDLDTSSKLILKKEFIKNNIVYDDVLKKYQIDENLGEKVCVIYADLLGIEIILSDDRGCFDLIKRKPRLKVRRLRDVLRKLGVNNVEAELIRLNSKDLDAFDSDLKTLESKGGLKSFANLGDVLKYKQRMS